MKRHKVAAFIAGFCLMICLLLTLTQLVVFSDGHFRKEYNKYQVPASIGMTLDNLMTVTDQMMDYLAGKRADLVVEATVNGRSREFFTDREKAHMADVRQMTRTAIGFRNLTLVAFLILAFIVKKSKAGWLAVVRGIRAASLAFVAMGAGLVSLALSDFNKYFILFHQLFFNNDLWLLDPRVSLLINIVPEGYFNDTAVLVLGSFLGIVAALFVGITILIRRRRQA